MLGKKNKGNKRDDKKYKAALEGRKIPILTLDNKWHQLIARLGGTPEIAHLTEKMNDLLKRQGKNNNDMKDLHLIKKRLMENIVASMDQFDDPLVDKKMDESRRLIEECNEKMNRCRDENLDLPREIDDVNYKLMVATMDLCYDTLKHHTKVIREIDDWLTRTRIELKKKVLKKQDSEAVNYELYSYMHDIFGSKVIEIFDMEYNPADRKPEKEKSGKK